MPLSPAVMLGWIERRSAVLNDYEQMIVCGRQEESLKTENEEARTLLVNGLKDVGEETDMRKDQPLHLLLEHAQTIKSEIDKKITQEEEHRKQISTARMQWDQAKEKFEKVERENQDWEASWHDALRTAGFSSDSSLQDVEFHLTTIKEIKEKVRRYLRFGRQELRPWNGILHDFMKMLGSW